MTNKYQKLLLDAYPGVEMLGYLDIDDTKAIADAVQSLHGTGDALFDFLWLDLGSCKTDGEALERIDFALNDLTAVRSAIAG